MHPSYTYIEFLILDCTYIGPKTEPRNPSVLPHSEKVRFNFVVGRAAAAAVPGGSKTALVQLCR
jgi:hypothetical protein